MRLNGLIGFVLATFVCLGCFVGQSDGAVIVIGANQPEATLAPAGAVVEFTNFTVRPGRKELEIKKIKVKKGGFGDIFAMVDVYIVAEKSPGVSQGNKGRIVMSSSVNINTVLDDSVELINLSEDGGLPTFTKPVKLSVYAKMGTSLKEFAGQVIYLRIESIIAINKKTGKEIELKGNFPIVGAGHTVNDSLQIGSLSMEAKEDFFYDITAGSEEPIGIRKIVMRANPSDEKSEPNSHFLYIEKTGVVIYFQREDNILYIIFNGEIVVEKGETLKIQIKQNEESLIRETISLYPEDIESYGNYYNFRIIPSWVAEG